MSNQSAQHPIHAGGVVEVTGEVEVKTGLRDLQAYGASFVGAPVAGAAFLHVEKSIVGGNAVLTIKVLTDAYAASSTAIDVSWNALGK